ncbi:MAG: protein-glutamate O-methyltransferase CheR [Chitinispirillales bacterium]|jgi:chemotaxis protein methyltransferase CheR|nr:protein-glutamate O-methyltransferase CheR [Chitinispirillales bacterium]
MDLDKRTFEAFRKLIYDKSGISLGDGKESLVSARLAKRLRALGYDTYKQYLDFLTGDSEEAESEFVEFLNVISTNLTYFFRENDHFAFMEEIVRQIVDEGRNKVRIWCAASSSGEEPYTIAMTFLENAQGFRGDCKILATDISTKILRMAKEGRYSEAKMQGVAPLLRSKYFTAVGRGAEKEYTVTDTLSSMITFSRLNLSKPPFPMKGPFDIIFCRNVMIYFDNIVRKRLMDEFSRLLRPGGYLMVGHAESMAGMLSDMATVRPSVYQKGG